MLLVVPHKLDEGVQSQKETVWLDFLVKLNFIAKLSPSSSFSWVELALSSIQPNPPTQPPTNPGK